LVVPAALFLTQAVGAQSFKLAPALALEAEDFTALSGWKVVQNGRGNYMVDAVGFNHVSGERLLTLDSRDDTGSAHADVVLPEPGRYRLWVRYEYPAFCEARFRVVVRQDGRTLLDHTAGKKDSPRYGFGEPFPKAQHDRPWGSEGLVEEVVTTPELKAGPARISLQGTPQPRTPGVAANRNVDLLYLTRDLDDAWLRHYRKQTSPYPILDAFRDTRGSRYEVRFINHGKGPADFHVTHVYNRVPWGVSEAESVRGLNPGAASAWLPLRAQDTTHFGLVRFSSSGQPFELLLRPVGGAVERRLSGPGPVQVYLPPYPGKGERAVTPAEEIDAVLAELKRAPAVGKVPTQPLCYGGWLPLGQDNDYGRKYAQLYAALGFRALHPAHSGPAVLANLRAVGVAPSKSWMVTGYRNPPLAANIERARRELDRTGLGGSLRWYDYGDEIGFSEWVQLAVQDEVDQARSAGQPLTAAQVLVRRWLEWLRANRPTAKVADYWLESWGPFHPSRLRPDSSAAAAADNPRLYVDSLLFYEETTLHFVAEGAREVRSELGDDVLCGASCSCHPFYYPHTTACVKWFRRGAADTGRHSEYFWQVGQAGPMVNGYIAEHFRAGLRDNPRGVFRPYTMPHAPGNTEASFLRSAFTHLAHGARALDFFAVGMDETFTENHIGHRARARYRALRDVTHAVGLVEDLLPASRPVPSPVALLVSESTERWDLAGIAEDFAGQAPFGPNFRKTRLNAHLDRLGIWTALTFLGSSPDLVLEEDLNAQTLKDYKVLVVVGDCLPPALVPSLEAWVRKGGVLLATANAGRYDSYRTPNPALQELLGLEARRTEEQTTFFRPRQELPFIEPLGFVAGPGWEMPQLATLERIVPARDVRVRARFKDDGSPAVVERRLGRGRLFYVAALPGVASLWSALQPPRVPDRGPGTHSVPTHFDPGARALLALVLRTASVEPVVATDPPLIDTRLLQAPDGYILPLANYHDKVGQKVKLTIRTDTPIRTVTSAYHGRLAVKQEAGRLVVTIPALGYGDVLRLEGDLHSKVASGDDAERRQSRAHAECGHEER
jgi:hypothetical protein